MRLYRLKFKMPAGWKREGLEAKRQRMADALVQQTKDRIEAGGDSEYQIPPKENGGGKALAGNTFLSHFQAFTNSKGFGVQNDFVGARLFLEGTVGKGGSLPPVTPKRAKVLSYLVAGLRRFSMKSEFVPRKYLRLASENIKQFGRILSGKE